MGLQSTVKQRAFRLRQEAWLMVVELYLDPLGHPFSLRISYGHDLCHNLISSFSIKHSRQLWYSVIFVFCFDNEKMTTNVYGA